MSSYTFVQTRSNNLYSVQYESLEDDTTQTFTLKRYIANKGVNLYEVEATYAKLKPNSKYYCFGRNICEASARFKAVVGSWMKINAIRVMDCAGAENILTHPSNSIII